LFAALRVRDFRLLWSGNAVSLLGTWLLTIAVPAHALVLTGSVMVTGLVLASQYLPVLILGPLAGVLADRWDRRRLMLATDLFRAAVVLLMVLARTPGAVWILYVALAAESAASILFRPAAQAHIPAVVGTGIMLSSANSLSAFTEGTVRLVGAPLGAALFVVLGFPALIVADAASYLLSALAIYLSAGRPVPMDRTRATVGRLGRDLRDGLAALARDRMARGLLLISTVFLAANASLSALLVPFGMTRLGGAEQTGLVVSALGVGFLLGAPLIRVLIDRWQPSRLLAASLAGTAVGFLLLFSAGSLGAAVPAAVVIGVFGSMTLMIPQITLQRALPNAVLGRVSSVFLTGEALATLAGAVLGATMAQVTQIVAVMWVACAVTVGAAALCLILLPVMPTILPADHRR
jgi:MFS family permease